MDAETIVKRLAGVPVTPQDYAERPELPLLVEAAREQALALAWDERWTVEEILQREG